MLGHKETIAAMAVAFSETTEKAKTTMRNAIMIQAEINHPWVIVTDAGTDHERIYEKYPSFSSAQIGLKELDYQIGGSDIMRCLDDGTLTTEF